MSFPTSDEDVVGFDDRSGRWLHNNKVFSISSSCHSSLNFLSILTVVESKVELFRENKVELHEAKLFSWTTDGNADATRSKFEIFWKQWQIEFSNFFSF